MNRLTFSMLLDKLAYAPESPGIRVAPRPRVSESAERIPRRHHGRRVDRPTRRFK